MPAVHAPDGCCIPITDLESCLFAAMSNVPSPLQWPPLLTPLKRIYFTLVVQSCFIVVVLISATAVTVCSRDFDLPRLARMLPLLLQWCRLPRGMHSKTR